MRPTQVTPSLGVQPTLLRKADSGEEPRSQIANETQSLESSQNTVGRIAKPSERVVSASKRQSEVLAPRNPKIQRFPTVESPASRSTRVSASENQSTPPPKVTWQRGHTSSPWRLNQTGRTLFKPQSIPSLKVHLSEEQKIRGHLFSQRLVNLFKSCQKRSRLGRTIQTRTDTASKMLPLLDFDFIL